MSGAKIGYFFAGLPRLPFAAAAFGRAFPLGTLAVNAIGSFFIGFLALKTQNFAEHWRLFLLAGLLAWFTTFSAFSHETMVLLGSKQFLLAGANVFFNVALSLIFVFAGYKTADFLSVL